MTVTQRVGTIPYTTGICSAFAYMGMETPGGTYESATTRRFFKGRTEVVRVVTNESDAIVRAMIEEDGKEEADVESRNKLFELAAEAHVANA